MANPTTLVPSAVFKVGAAVGSVVDYTDQCKALVVNKSRDALDATSFGLTGYYRVGGLTDCTMTATLLVNDKLLVQKVSLWTGEPDRGDIVVFEDPGGWLGVQGDTVDPNVFQKALETIGLFPTGNHLIKRVVALGGESIEIKDCAVLVDGMPIPEPYLDEAATSTPNLRSRWPRSSLPSLS